MRLRAKRDLTEPAIIQALERTGWTVLRLSVKDAPDLLIGRAGVTELVEVKSPTGQLRPGQVEWIMRWRGRPVRVMRVEEDVLALNAGLEDSRPESPLTVGEARSGGIVTG